MTAVQQHVCPEIHPGIGAVVQLRTRRTVLAELVAKGLVLATGKCRVSIGGGGTRFSAKADNDAG